MSIKNLTLRTAAKIILPLTPVSSKAVNRYWREYNQAYDWVKTLPDGYDYVANQLSDATGIPFVEVGNVSPSEISHTYAATKSPLTRQGHCDKNAMLNDNKPVGWYIGHGVRPQPDQWVTSVRTPAGKRQIDIHTWGIFKGLKSHYPKAFNDWATRYSDRPLFPFYEHSDVFQTGDKVLLTVCDKDYKVPVELPWQASKTHSYLSSEYEINEKKLAKANKLRQLRSWLLLNAANPAGLPQNRR